MPTTNRPPNIKRLRKNETVMLLNSTPLGAVTSERTMARDCTRAGYRICSADRRHIDLIKYGAWLLDELADRRTAAGPRDYDAVREAARARSEAISASGRDIGPLPPVENPERRARAAGSLLFFCETYFPETFYLDWSEDHLRVIKKIETAVRDGGLFALAMPRAEGKTAICERAALWATLHGYRKFVVPIGASAEAALETIDVIQDELENNDLLAADYPEVCYPIRRLEGIVNRSAGQLLDGKRTRICWNKDEIRFPTIPDVPGSGAIIKSVGITGRIRGMKKKADGSDLRPDMVLVDDPQTDESANSPEQNRKRLRVLSGAILGLSGPGKKISGVMPCTVIRPGDMADEILNRDKHPEWNGERLRLLHSFPDNMELWNRYREIQVDSFRRYGDNRDATEFYRDHQTEMDAGAVSSWPERFEPDELSGIQYAMNLYFRDRETFYAEYQNEPLPDDAEDVDKLTVNDVWDRLNHRKRGEVPKQATTITMFIDVQKNLLYYMVCAFSENFTGWIIDYGAFPDQRRRYFTLAEANPTYQLLYPGAGLEGAIQSAIRDLTDDYLTRDWIREDGVPLRIERCLIDSGWGRSTEAVYRACRESVHAGTLLPSKGIGITAAQRPMTEYRKNQGDKIGLNWMIPSARRKQVSRRIDYDTNFFKSFFRERLLTTPGDPGSFTVFGSDEEQHRMLAEQLTSETSEPTSGRGRRVDIWSLIPGRENHLLDCAVGCMVAASERGCLLLKPEAPSCRSKISNGRTGGKGRIFQPGKVFTPRG